METWLRVKEIFHGALDLEPLERDAYLTSSCGDDHALRHEVERLLDAHSSAGEFIEQSPVALAGRVIGHYKIERPIGAGGMGEVYVAQDLELGRTVAIKLALGSDADAHARLKREAQHASQLNHPNVCTIHEIASFDGRPYIAMEFVAGKRLTDLIADGGLPVAQVARYGAQIASALAHAHGHGVIHRDLKSANVMVTSDDRVKVLDFGLARRHSAESLKDLSLSRETIATHELMAGTLSCMAPELLRGGTADAPSDIWSLGVLLFEMAAGKRPFTGATGFELSGAILHQPPAPLPDTVPVPLKQVILRCLDKDPVRRYQHAEDVRRAIEGASHGESRAVPLGAIAVAAAIALLVVAWAAGPPIWRAMRTEGHTASADQPSSRAIAIMNFENVAGAPDTAWLSKGVPRMLVTGLAQTSGLHIVSAQHLDEAARKMGGASADVLNSAEFADVARQSGASAVVSGTIMKAGDDIRVDVQLHDLASGRVLAAETARGPDVFAVADRLTTRIRAAAGFSDSASVRPVVDVSSSSLEAYRLYSEGVDACLNMRWADAMKLLEKAVEIDPGFADAYLQLAVVMNYRGSQATRAEYLGKAAQYADRLNNQQRRFLELQLARGTANAAEVGRLLDAFLADYPLVEEAYSNAGSIYNPMLGGLFDPPKLLSILEGGVRVLPASGSLKNSYGYALLANGRPADALREFQTYARLAPREPNPYDSMGEAYLNLGLPEKAAESYAHALSIDPTFIESRTGEAFARAMLGRYDEAIALDPPVSSIKALLLSRAGRYREAARVMAAAPKGLDTMIGVFSEAITNLMSALFALERGDHVRAMREAESATHVIAAAEHPRKSTFMVLVHLVAGIAAIRNGQMSEARSRLEQQNNVPRSAFVMEKWWRKSLEAEIALASNDTKRASAAFAEGVPPYKYFGFEVIGVGAIVNHLPSRDGLARAAKAEGDLPRAIADYRRLVTPGVESKFLCVLEPRYVLELARLLEKTGDTRNALVEYQRFFELWKHADSDLPELDEARRAVRRLQTARTN